ncbi:MAG: peptidylprolyl isomerase [Cellvibrionales bacterium]|nr:peptidylprolyl isomerase [Cellvibrionales bacterium]
MAIQLTSFFQKTLFAALFCLSLTMMWHPGAQAAYVGIDKIIVIVDDDVITLSDYEDAKAQVLKNIDAQGQPMPDEATLKKATINNLILERIQLQMAKRVGVQITEEQLTQAMSQLAKSKGLSLEEFISEANKRGQTTQQIRDQIKKELTIQQVQQGFLRNRININEQAIEEYLKSDEGKSRIQSKYTLSHLLIRSQDANAQNVLAQVVNDIQSGKRQFSDFNSSQTIDGFQVENGDLGTRTQNELPSLFADIILNMQPGDYSKPVKSGAGWHVVKLDDLSGAAKIIHQVHARHILIKPSEVRSNKQAKRLINDLYKRIKKGEDFSLIAKEYSDDPGSALLGGDLDWAEPSKYVGNFKKTLEKLKNDEISKPFETEFGWHIAQKLGERDHNVTDEVRKNQAFQTLYQRKAAEEVDSWLNQIQQDAYIEFKDPSFDPNKINTQAP